MASKFWRTRTLTENEQVLLEANSRRGGRGGNRVTSTVTWMVTPLKRRIGVASFPLSTTVWCRNTGSQMPGRPNGHRHPHDVEQTRRTHDDHWRTVSRNPAQSDEILRESNPTITDLKVWLDHPLERNRVLRDLDRHISETVRVEDLKDETAYSEE